MSLVAAAALGGAWLFAIHLLSLAQLLPAWRALPGAARGALGGVGPHLAVFQLALAAAVASAGAGCGVATWLTLRALGLRAGASRVLGAVTLLALAQTARMAAQRPALFETWLWRRGGAPAALQVLLTERLGAPALDRALLLTVAAILLLALFRRRASLARQRTRLALIAFFIGLVLAGYALLARHGRAQTRGTSVVVLAADSLRPDHFSSEGYPRATTPKIDALRKSGLWVADEFVPIASTTASWASLLTGVYPHSHGIRDLFPRGEQTRLHLPLLPRILEARGYQTAVVSDYAGETFRRVDFGFGLVDAPPATSVEIFAEREAFQLLPLALAFFSGPLGQRLFPVAGYLMTNADPDALTDRVLRRLDALEQSSQPFFLLAFYSVTHAPFAAPPGDVAAFADPAYRGQSRYSYDVQQVKDIPRLATRPDEPEVEQVRALYDGALRAFDRQVGRVRRQLDADGLHDRLLVITGDHGEGLFEPGATTEHGKWFAGGEAANRTALLLEGKGIAAGVARGVASGVDFLPTVLDALHLPLPAEIDGQSLLRPLAADRTVFAETGLWLGGKASAPPHAIEYPAIVELLEVEEESHALVLRRQFAEIANRAKLRAARAGPYQLVYTPTGHGARWELFDAEHDRFFQHDLAAARPEVLRPLQRRLLHWLAEDPLRWLNADDELVPRVEE